MLHCNLMGLNRISYNLGLANSNTIIDHCTCSQLCTATVQTFVPFSKMIMQMKLILLKDLQYGVAII